jgi:hypothetical protein
MTIDLDTFLVTLYTLIDDLYLQHLARLKPRRPGKKPVLSDSEVLTLAVVAQWAGRSERKFLRYAAAFWRSYFPCLLSQSAFNRRVADLGGVLVHLIPLLAQELQAMASPYQVLDGVPVPLARCCRGKKHRLFANEAQVGKGGSDRNWYFGCQLLAVVSCDGVITGFILGPANTELRWAAEYLFCWRKYEGAVPWGPEDLPPSHRKGGGYVGPTGPIWPDSGVGAHSLAPYVADLGLSGKVWGTHWASDYQAYALTPEKYLGDTAKAACREHSACRRVVETVNDILENTLHLSYPGSRSCLGLLARLASKLAAVNLGIWINRLFGRPTLALLTLFN